MLLTSFSISTPNPPLSKSTRNLFSESVTLTSLKFVGICVTSNLILNEGFEELLQYLFLKATLSCKYFESVLYLQK